jgi:hypothetical protein
MVGSIRAFYARDIGFNYCTVHSNFCVYEYLFVLGLDGSMYDVYLFTKNKLYIIIHTYITLALYPRRISRDILDTLRHLHVLELLRASEGTLSRWFRLHLQSLAPTNPGLVVSYGPFSLCVF